MCRVTEHYNTFEMLARPRCEVCASCKSLRRGSSRSPTKICMYQIENLTPMDLKDPSVRKMLRKDKSSLAIAWSELRSMWKAPPTHTPPTKSPTKTTSKFEDEDPNRETSLQSAMIAREHLSATIIQRKYLAHMRRERFRAWVRLAMNTDAGRNKCSTIIASKFWRRTKCMMDYHDTLHSIVCLQKFYRIVHARKLFMKRAIIKLRGCLHNVLGQDWRLHRIVDTVGKSGRKRDRERIRLATEYLVNQGHGKGLSVYGILSLCKELEKTAKNVEKKKKRLMKQWKKIRPKTWETNTSDPVSKWYDRQRRSRERQQLEESEFQRNRKKILEERRAKKKELEREEDTC